MRGQFLSHLFIGVTTLLQAAVIVNCAPSSWEYVPRSNGSSSSGPGTTNTTSTSSSSSSVAPAAVYNGSYATAHDRGVYLRIGNGGAGQSGLIGALADAFIQYRVSQGDEPFEVAWYLGDTTQSLAFLADGTIDVAVTYNAAAEKQSLDSGAAVRTVYAFRDHFLLVGPKANPAKLADSDDVYMIFNKLVTSGKSDVTTPPDSTVRPSTRFLSRFDKSATNIKESQLFIEIGQVPWAYDYSKWYHQYPRFPLESLEAASLLSEYTLTDFGTWTSSTDAVRSRLNIFKRGADDESDPLLNPAHALFGARATHADVGRSFMDWLALADGGQKVIRTFSKNGVVLYSEAPRDGQ